MSAMRFRYRYGTSGVGGYRGKARIYRDRSRASRISAQQTIDEYFDGGEDHGERRIRIGHRSEFFPTASSVETDVVARHEQLNLPLDERRGVGGPVREEASCAEPVVRLHRPELEQHEQCEEPAAEATPAPVERPKRAPYEWFVDRRPSRAKKFQRGHFLYGCVLGTAAAVLILAMLRVAFM